MLRRVAGRDYVYAWEVGVRRNLEKRNDYQRRCKVTISKSENTRSLEKVAANRPVSLNVVTEFRIIFARTGFKVLGPIGS